MAKELTDYEARLLRYIAREVGIDRHTGFHIVRNFICSVGRIALRHFRHLDALDPDIIVLGDEHLPIGGHIDRAVDEGLKAQQRANYYVRRHGDQIRHIIDWFSVAGRENHGWIYNLDNFGRPKKLMKCGSIDDLVREADEQFRRMRHRRHQVAMDHAHEYARVHAAVAEVIELTEDDVRFEADLGGGLKLYRLLTPAALDDETSRMEHCVGFGSYDHKVKNPEFGFFSIRTADDIAVATVEVHDMLVNQFYGPRNFKPAPDVEAAFNAYCSAVGWEHWRTKARRHNEYFQLCRLLGYSYNRPDTQRFADLDFEDQSSELTLLRRALNLGPGDPIPAPAVEPFEAMDGQVGVQYFIEIDENGEPVEIEIDPNAIDPLAPRP